MLNYPLLNLIKMILKERSAIKFIVGVFFSFSFSISVILGTIGIMDGFDSAIKQALKLASGDILISSYYHSDFNLQKKFFKLSIDDYTEYIEIKGFLIFDEVTKGVVVKGIDPQTFRKVTDLMIDFKNKDEIFIGKELKKELGIKKGDKITLALARNNQKESLLPLLASFQVAGSVSHQIYQKDMRFVYISKKYLAQLLSITDRKVNRVSLNISNIKNIDFSSTDYIDKVKEYSDYLQNSLGATYRVVPFWKEYKALIEAVKVEKVTISIILQLIIIISIFNIGAFIVYLKEKRSKEMFLFQALGMSSKKLFKMWFIIIVSIWLISCCMSYVLINVFNFFLFKFRPFEIPGEIYNLSRLYIKLQIGDYLLIFGLALIWVMILLLIMLFKLKKTSVLQGLRKEFI